jgi:hypothetical protein
MAYDHIGNDWHSGPTTEIGSKPHARPSNFSHSQHYTFHKGEDFNPQTEEPKYKHFSRDQTQNPLNNHSLVLKTNTIRFICVMYVCSKHFTNTKEECRRYVNLFRKVAFYVKYGEKDHIHDCYIGNCKQNASKAPGEFQSLFYHLCMTDISSLGAAWATVPEKQTVIKFLPIFPIYMELGVH